MEIDVASSTPTLRGVENLAQTPNSSAISTDTWTVFVLKRSNTLGITVSHMQAGVWVSVNQPTLNKDFKEQCDITTVGALNSGGYTLVLSSFYIAEVFFSSNYYTDSMIEAMWKPQCICAL